VESILMQKGRKEQEAFKKAAWLEKEKNSNFVLIAKKIKIVADFRPIYANLYLYKIKIY
jgi:hypothetical protein